MKKHILFIILFLVVSCVTHREIIQAPEIRPSEVETPVPVQKLLPEVSPPVVKYQSYLQCDEKTKDFFNSSGIEVLPFMRVIFFDINGDGMTEMIAGSKDGSLRLFRNTGLRKAPHWRLDDGYFEGISAGAFSAPAAGDIDGDGKPEILLGTGGFSRDSGRVIFYKNTGTPVSPVWKKMDMPEIDVGDAATPALVDVDNDGRLDLVVGNSTGRLFLFRSLRTGQGLSFKKDAAYFKDINPGMYVVPAVTSYQNRIVLVTGNSMGKLYLFERGYESRALWKRTSLSLSFCSFAAPAFVPGEQSGPMDLVISDGEGQLYYYLNREKNYREWESSGDFFSGRIFAGPASSPTVTELNGSSVMVVGNINGEIRLYINKRPTAGLPWKEVPGYFSGIKLSSFSKGTLTEWDGRSLLVTGQQDGIIRAFFNTGPQERPFWVEDKKFFRGVPRILHAAPAVFDIEGDGKWELVVGGSDGYVRGFRYETGEEGNPVWLKIEKIFDYAKVGRFASPSLAREKDKTYLFLGQQDGKVRVFTADPVSRGSAVFYPDEYLLGIQVNDHSCPAAFEKMGFLELTVGDYNGNLKHFACRPEKREIKDN